MKDKIFYLLQDMYVFYVYNKYVCMCYYIIIYFCIQ